MICRAVGSVVGMLVDRSVLWGFSLVGRVAERVVPADQAEWLANLESETEVLEPGQLADFPGCDCQSRQAADLDDHAWNCGARPCLECGHLASAHSGEHGGGIITPCMVSECDCLDCILVRRPHPVDAAHHGGFRLEVQDGNVTPIPLAVNAESIKAIDALQDAMWCASHETTFGLCKRKHEPTKGSTDSIEAILEYHRVNDGLTYRDGLWCNCGAFCLNTSNHRRHVAQVITDRDAADARVVAGLLPGDAEAVARDIDFCFEAGDLGRAREQLGRLIALLAADSRVTPTVRKHRG